MFRTSRFVSWAVTAQFALAFLFGCSAPAGNDISGAVPSAEMEHGSPQAAMLGDASSSQKLEAIWRTRTQGNLSSDFPIGPGDVVKISVPGMPELNDREARVSADYKIELPVLGTVDVRGRGESAVRKAVRDHLMEYMKNPQVDVFVKQYQSREVAVDGMVEKPGLYTLTGPSDTILDMVGRAGGVKENASTRIVFIPAAASPGARVPLQFTDPDRDDSKLSGKPESAAGTGAAKPVSPERPHDKAITDAASNRSEDHASTYYSMTPAAGRDPIVIDISSLKNNYKLDVPAWPGDVIIVPAAGEVMVRGWVKNPGAFNITPGMTVLGAVTAAGGELYSSSAELLRTADDGQESKEYLNLSRIQRGTETDRPVQSGDVVIVDRSVAGAVPYFLDTLFTKFSTGAYLPLL